MSRRFAIYYAPPAGSALEHFGSAWLGRSHVTGERLPRPVVDGFSADELEAFTAFPRAYGFHATLKAPFVLPPGRSEADLHAAARAFAADRSAFLAPPLRVTGLSSFIAFHLSEPSPEMQRLADECVRAFEPFRAPLPDHELDRRRQGGLTPRQERYLVSWGYPYVFEESHFHMTLTGPLDAAIHARLLPMLQERARPFAEAPLPVDAIAIYMQPDRATPFTLTARFPFEG